MQPSMINPKNQSTMIFGIEVTKLKTTLAPLPYLLVAKSKGSKPLMKEAYIVKKGVTMHFK